MVLKQTNTKRRNKSVKLELIKKSREAMLSAVQIYNNPQITFKSETYITLSVIAWTYLLHAYYKEKEIDYRYYHYVGKRKRYYRTRNGAFKHWELEQCLDNKECPIDRDTKNNLKFLIGIRHEIEHQMTNRIDEFLSAKLQACAINYDFYLCKLFGQKYNISNELSLAIQFSPLSPEQRNILQSNEHITSNIRNYVVNFEDVLSDDELTNSRYAYRILFLPINAKRKGQADQVVEFIDSNSPLAEGLEKQYALIKETEKRKYRPSEIVSIMQEKGYDFFTMSMHTYLWKSIDAKNPSLGYGVEISKQWYWYDKWLSKVEEYCKDYACKIKDCTLYT